MVTFNFSTARRIVFGPGRLTELGALAAQSGRRVCLVTGRSSLENNGRLAQIGGILTGAGLTWTHFPVSKEPTVELVDEAIRQARNSNVDVVVAIGGGSVIDTGKALAALLANGGEALDYLEGVGRGRKLEKPSVPLIAVPTTAGSGSEVTKNAVLGDEAHTFKKSMRSEGMLPAVALVDPDLLVNCPVPVIAACGMDAVTQLLEAFTSRQANPLTDAQAGLGLGLASELPFFYDNPADPHPREAMAMASLLGGMALSNAGLGAVHGLASPIGAHYPIPHGAICAALLPAVVRQNALAAARAQNTWLLTKYCAAAAQLVGTLQTGNESDEIPEGVMDACENSDDALHIALALSDYLSQLNKRLNIRRLGEHGIRREDIPHIVAEGRGSSMQTNPVDLSDEDLAEILRNAL